MPSRAVLRKKSRREKKSRTTETAAPAKALSGSAAKALSDSPAKALSGSAAKALSDSPAKVLSDSAAKALSGPAAKALSDSPAKALSGSAAKALSGPAGRKRGRPDDGAEGLSRRDRRRAEVRQRHERALDRLSAAAPRAADPAAAGDAAAPVRHDPKFANGTFWRTRKERRARTLFLGNFPARFDAGGVADYISAAADADDVQSDAPGKLVDDVDFLPAQPRARRRHMFVTICTRDAAERVAQMLDGRTIDGAALRCNFAGDKAQRGVAIERRATH